VSVKRFVQAWPWPLGVGAAFTVFGLFTWYRAPSTADVAAWGRHPYMNSPWSVREDRERVEDECPLEARRVATAPARDMIGESEELIGRHRYPVIAHPLQPEVVHSREGLVRPFRLASSAHTRSVAARGCRLVATIACRVRLENRSTFATSIDRQRNSRCVVLGHRQDG
jgi:hypothetical protein